MPGKVSGYHSRKEYDQLKRDKISNKKSVLGNEGLVEKRKKLIRRKTLNIRHILFEIYFIYKKLFSCNFVKLSGRLY
jgi:hypothetical protein